MDYKVIEVHSFSEETYGQWGSHRVSATVEKDGQAVKVSAFMKQQPKVGDTWTGEIKKVEKNGKNFTNFEFAKKTAQAPSNDPRIGQLQTTVAKLDFKLDSIIRHLSGTARLDKTSDGNDMPFPDYEVNDGLEPPF